MNNKSIFAKPGFLSFSTFCAEILALFIIYVHFTDEFLHSLLFFILFLALFIFCFIISSSFKTGKKELMKAAAASLFTFCFIFHAMAFVDMISLNYYYFFTGNYIITCIAVIAILLFILFIFAFGKHFAINTSNESKTKEVLSNKHLLLIIGVLGLVQAGLITYNDYTIGRVSVYFDYTLPSELYLILSYIMFFFISLILICIETLINEFRLAREKGELETFATNLVGKKATAVAIGKKPTTPDKKPTKTATTSDKKSTKKSTTTKKTKKK